MVNQRGRSKRQEGAMHICSVDSRHARQEGGYVYISSWKRAGPILFVPDVQLGVCLECVLRVVGAVR